METGIWNGYKCPKCGRMTGGGEPLTIPYVDHNSGGFLMFKKYDGEMYVNPKCPNCRHGVFNHWDGSEFYCVKCDDWFPESDAVR